MPIIKTLDPQGNLVEVNGRAWNSAQAAEDVVDAVNAATTAEQAAGTENALAKFVSPTGLTDASFSDNGQVMSSATAGLGTGAAADPCPGGAKNWFEGFGDPDNSAIVWVESLETGRTALDSSLVHLNNSSVVVPAGGTVQSVGLRVIQDPTRSGAGTLNSVGILIDTNAGDTNQAILATHGTIRVDDGGSFGPTAVTGLSSDPGTPPEEGKVTLEGGDASFILFTGTGGNITTEGTIIGNQVKSVGNLLLSGGSLWFDESSLTDIYIYTQNAGASGNTAVNIQAAGTGPVRINSNTGGSTNSGVGGLEVYKGNNSTDKVFVANATSGVSKIGFYNTTPVAQQTGVAVTAAAIHAALVALGLITA